MELMLVVESKIDEHDYEQHDLFIVSEDKTRQLTERLLKSINALDLLDKEGTPSDFKQVIEYVLGYVTAFCKSTECVSEINFNNDFYIKRKWWTNPLYLKIKLFNLSAIPKV